MFHPDIKLYNTLLYAWIACAILIFPILLTVTAPYGRHSNRKWGPVIPNRAGWIIMELPALGFFSLYFFSGPETKTPVLIIFAVFWIIHYTNRALIFPFRIRSRYKKIPLLIVLFSIIFNFLNGSFNGYYLGSFQHNYDGSWLTDPRFIAGGVMFIAGMLINISADNYLIRARKLHKETYVIPSGGLFSYVSCPNFLGEIIEWTGFAIMVWNPAGLAFALWTFANLVPRAMDHHRWYKEKFEDYPAERKAFIPYLL